MAFYFIKIILFYKNKIITLWEILQKREEKIIDIL